MFRMKMNDFEKYPVNNEYYCLYYIFVYFLFNLIIYINMQIYIPIIMYADM